MERIISVEDDNEALKEGANMFIRALLNSEKFFKQFIKTDYTEKPSKTDLDRYFNTEKCVICHEKFVWSRDYYPGIMFIHLSLYISVHNVKMD